MKSNQRRLMSAMVGFTLIEVMVTVFILAVGVLGIAGMQAVGVRESQNTYFRSQADVLIEDMIAKLMNNRQASVNDSSNPYTNAPGVGTDCISAICTKEQMAAFDLQEWTKALTNSKLPGVRGDVTLVNQFQSVDGNPIGSQYAVQVFWDEERTGTSVAAGTLCDPATMSCLRALVQIL